MFTSPKQPSQFFSYYFVTSVIMKYLILIASLYWIWTMLLHHKLNCITQITSPKYPSRCYSYFFVTLFFYWSLYLTIREIQNLLASLTYILVIYMPHQTIFYHILFEVMLSHRLSFLTTSFTPPLTFDLLGNTAHKFCHFFCRTTISDSNNAHH